MGPSTSKWVSLGAKIYGKPCHPSRWVSKKWEDFQGGPANILSTIFGGTTNNPKMVLCFYRENSCMAAVYWSRLPGDAGTMRPQTFPTTTNSLMGLVLPLGHWDHVSIRSLMVYCSLGFYQLDQVFTMGYDHPLELSKEQVHQRLIIILLIRLIIILVNYLRIIL